VISLYRFPAHRLGVYAPSVGAGRTMPVGPLSVLSQSGAEAALNGPMFEVCGDDCDVLDYLHYDPSRGVTAQGRYPSRGITVYVLNGVPHAARGRYAPDASSAAVQLYPPLVWNGSDETNPSLNTAAEWRAALCIMDDGNLAFAVGGPSSMTSFSRGLVEAGAVYAGYTDGGSSTSLVTPGGIDGSPRRSRVASWLVVNPSGLSGTLVASLGLGAAAAYWYYRRRRLRQK